MQQPFKDLNKKIDDGKSLPKEFTINLAVTQSRSLSVTLPKAFGQINARAKLVHIKGDLYGFTMVVGKEKSTHKINAPDSSKKTSYTNISGGRMKDVFGITDATIDNSRGIKKIFKAQFKDGSIIFDITEQNLFHLADPEELKSDNDYVEEMRKHIESVNQLARKHGMVLTVTDNELHASLHITI